METIPLKPVYSPHLKKVLKSYQLAAGSSLSGPSTLLRTDSVDSGVGKSATVMDVNLSPSPPPVKNDKPQIINCVSVAPPVGVTNTTAISANSKETTTASSSAVKFVEVEPFLNPPPFPIQQLPILTASDQRSEASETVLEGETISCFVVGGEKRLCLPQILNSVLRDFSLNQINQVCDELQIFCSRCNPEQLDVLKYNGILPASAPSCGLITKTDAERLCSSLLHRNPPKADSVMHEQKRPPLSFKVYHECFGKCSGLCTPDVYTCPSARCIECLECRGLFNPQRFVCHAHRSLENRTCHWGFDSNNWRSYLQLVKEQGESEKLSKRMEEFKARFDNSVTKRKQTEEPREEPAKKARCEDPYPYLYAADAYLYWYGQFAARMPFSAFPPWPPILSKDGKPIAAQSPIVFRDSVPTSVPAYLSQGPPVLLNPERVISLAESERFERSFQPNVALAPLTRQQRQTQVKAEPVKILPNICKSEIELSSDTDEGSECRVDTDVECAIQDDVTTVRSALVGVPDSAKNLVINVVERLASRVEEAERGYRRALMETAALQRQISEMSSGRTQTSKDTDAFQLKVISMEKELRSLRQELATMPSMQNNTVIGSSSPVSVITSPLTIKAEPLTTE